MTEFELLSVPIGLVLGLGMTNILSGIITAVRNRKQVRLHWIPFMWAFNFMMQLMTFFFVIWDLNVRFELIGENWTWKYYGPQMFHSVLIFLGAGMILPTKRESNIDTLIGDFEEHGRLALIPLMLAHLAAWPLNMYLHGASMFAAANYMNVVCIGVIFLGFKSTKRVWQSISSISFGVIFICCIFTIWSRPGHVDEPPQRNTIEEASSKSGVEIKAKGK